jgi:hypothetical protein
MIGITASAERGQRPAASGWRQVEVIHGGSLAIEW